MSESLHTTSHHPWCNYFTRPVAGCKMCKDLWARYPLEEGQTTEDLVREHFPDVVKRNGIEP